MFAERLKQARKIKRYSQAEISQLLGVTQQAVGKWETGRSTPDPQTIARLEELRWWDWEEERIARNLSAIQSGRPDLLE